MCTERNANLDSGGKGHRAEVICPSWATLHAMWPGPRGGVPSGRVSTRRARIGRAKVHIATDREVVEAPLGSSVCPSNSPVRTLG